MEGLIGDASIGLVINIEEMCRTSGRVERSTGDRKEYQDRNTFLLLSMNRPELKSVFR